MKTKTFRQKFISKAWVMGFMGFLGLLGFIFPVEGSFILIFFSFFGFFALYWESKVDDEIVDERLLENKYKAGSKAFNTAFVIIWIVAILMNSYTINFFPILNNPQAKYNCLLMTIGFSFAIGLNLNAYLLYYYETKE